MEIYVKPTSNSDGMSLTSFEVLGPQWDGNEIELPFGDDGRILPVVGWTDLYTGTACPVHVVKVRYGADVGFLIYGGNSGVRVLDSDAEAEDHLPAGFGMPIIWVEDLGDLPAQVRAVVESNASSA